MKKLSKKLSMVSDTVEAFTCWCACPCYCLGVKYAVMSRNNKNNSSSYLDTANNR